MAFRTPPAIFRMSSSPREITSLVNSRTSWNSSFQGSTILVSRPLKFLIKGTDGEMFRQAMFHGCDRVGDWFIVPQVDQAVLPARICKRLTFSRPFEKSDRLNL